MNQVKGNGASTTLFQHDRPNKPRRSRFDLSRKANFSIDVGMIAPFDSFEVYPGDKVDIDLKMAVDTLPLVQSSLTNYKIVTHWYYMKYRDCWKGWKTFSTKGRTGNINLTLPQVDLSLPISKEVSYSISAPNTSNESNDLTKSQTGYMYAVSKHSLGAYLGVPPWYDGFYGFDNFTDGNPYIQKEYLPYSFFPNKTSSGEWNADSVTKYEDAVRTGFNKYSKVSALPFVAYQSIVKNYYLNQNTLQDNTALFPIEGDDDWLLPYTIENGVANYISGRSVLDDDDVVNYDGVYSKNETDVDLRLLRYSSFDDDYFTTGLPWLQRGEANSLESELLGELQTSLDWSNVNLDVTDEPYGVTGYDAYPKAYVNFSPYTSSINEKTDSRDAGLNLSSSVPEVVIDGNATNPYSTARLLQYYPNLLNELKKVQPTIYTNRARVEFTANQLRKLIAYSVWQERNARVDGSYNKMIYQHWSENPHSEEHKPVYIGGSVDYLNFSTIVQNSESTDSNPLGSTAGYGSSSGSADVAHFNVPDVGIIIGVMMIKPETVYQQGIEHFLTQKVFDDFPQPEFEGLSPQEILNKEIYVSGDNTDEDMFSYQERYTYLKVRQNVNRGLFQCKPDKDRLFGSFTQARWFSKVPEWSYQFMCMSPNNIRRDWLAYPSYPAFRVQALSNVFLTRNFAYTSQPNTFGF